jgi:BMFP domain-containing protein YqiC
MPQTSGGFFDELGKLMTDAAGAADGMRREVEAIMRAQAERLVRGMDLVPREQFEAVKALAEKARAENDVLATRIAGLEARLAALEATTAAHAAAPHHGDVPESAALEPTGP